jgi:hypothetical protein
MDEQEDIDSAAEHHQTQTEQRRKQAEGWEWWTSYYDSLLALRRKERKQLQEMNFALDRLFDRDPQ